METERTSTAGVQRPHVEDVDALHLAENLQALETGGLLEVGRDGAGLAALREQVVFVRDLCGLGILLVSHWMFLRARAR